MNTRGEGWYVWHSLLRGDSLSGRGGRVGLARDVASERTFGVRVSHVVPPPTLLFPARRGVTGAGSDSRRTGANGKQDRANDSLRGESGSAEEIIS